jgi:hypothetical protein
MVFGMSLDVIPCLPSINYLSFVSENVHLLSHLKAHPTYHQVLTLKHFLKPFSLKYPSVLVWIPISLNRTVKTPPCSMGQEGSLFCFLFLFFQTLILYHLLSILKADMFLKKKCKLLSITPFL